MSISFPQDLLHQTLTVSSTEILSMATGIIAQCDISRNTYYILVLVYSVTGFLGDWLLTFVMVFTLNKVLREHLGNFSIANKYSLLVVMGLVAAVSIAQLAVSCYNIWTVTDAGYYKNALYEPAERLRVAWAAICLAATLAGGAFAITTIRAMRSRRHACGVSLLSHSPRLRPLTIARICWVGSSRWLSPCSFGICSASYSPSRICLLHTAATFSPIK